MALLKGGSLTLLQGIQSAILNPADKVIIVQKDYYILKVFERTDEERDLKRE